jgi:hypothetical protein
MATIKTISFILYSDIELVDDFMQMRSARKSKIEIFQVVFDDHRIQTEGNEAIEAMEVDDQDDAVVNTIASSLQLFTSLFCVNFILRKPILMEISKLVLRYNFSSEMAMKIFEKILAFLKCNAESLMDTNSLENLLTQWIVNSLTLVT